MDADEKAKDAISEKGQDSEDKAQKDSTQPKVYTEDEAEAKFSQQRSILDKKVDKLEKQIKSSEGKDAQITELKGRLSTIQRERRDVELESARDDPDELKRIRRRQKDDERDADLAKRELELRDSAKTHQELLDELTESNKEKNALEIAIKYNVPFEILYKHCSSLEEMEALAPKLARGKQEEQKEPSRPDSGTTAGGGEKSEQDKLDARYPKMK